MQPTAKAHFFVHFSISCFYPCGLLWWTLPMAPCFAHCFDEMEQLLCCADKLTVSVSVRPINWRVRDSIAHGSPLSDGYIVRNPITRPACEWVGINVASNTAWVISVEGCTRSRSKILDTSLVSLALCSRCPGRCHTLTPWCLLRILSICMACSNSILSQATL